jgi:hypothetical protein
MIIRAENFIQENEILEELTKHGIEFQFLTPKNTLSTFYVTGSFNFKELEKLTPEHFIIQNDSIIYDFDSGWKKAIETESMRNAIESNDNIKTDNSQVIANLQEQLKDIESYVCGGWQNDLEPSDKKVNKGFEMAMNEIARQFFISGEVMDIASKYEITPELIEELKQFLK